MSIGGGRRINLDQLLSVLDDVLNLGGKAQRYDLDTKLRGSVPQLDSMAVVSLVAALEEQFGVEFPENKLDGAVFETVGTLFATVSTLVSPSGDRFLSHFIVAASWIQRTTTRIAAPRPSRKLRLLSGSPGS